MSKRRVISCILMLFPFLLSAQPVVKGVPELDFAHLEKNMIVFPGDSSAFDRFFERLDSVCRFGKGKLSILHVGGSHVQGGTMTRELRNDFLALGNVYGRDMDGGMGLVFPVSTAKTNNPSGYKTRTEGTWTNAKSIQKEPASRLGLAGMAVSTSDSLASVGIVLTPRNPVPEDVQCHFDEVRLLGFRDEGDFEPVVVLPSGDTLLPSMQSDSCRTFSFTSLQDSVRIAFRGSKGSFTITGIFLDRKDVPGITVSGVGVNGATLTAYSRCMDLERDLAVVRPDLVVLAIGINDAIPADFSEDVFKARYKALVGRIRSVCPGCAVLFVTNNDSFRHSRKKGYYVNTNGERARHAFLELGKECGAGVWDQFEIMGGLGSMKKWETASLARRDKIHFTDDGYMLLGDLLFNALMDKFEEHLERKER